MEINLGKFRKHAIISPFLRFSNTVLAFPSEKSWPTDFAMCTEEEEGNVI